VPNKSLYMWVAVAAVGSSLQLALPSHLWAGAGGVSYSKPSTAPSQKTGQQKQGKGAESPNVWTNVTEIRRPPKPGRARPPRLRAALLTLEYRILKEAENGAPIETSPNAVFYTGDRLQLRVKTNQDGYLYIVQGNDGDDGTIIFPDSQINNGENSVNKNKELIVPFKCESKRKDDCWFEFGPPPGREIFTVIFSREAVPETITRITARGGIVKWRDIAGIHENAKPATSRPNLSPQQGGGAGRYIQWVTNIDPKNNEELIKKVMLDHKEPERSNRK
jgi:uncharacterized protein DUF4384